jgi:hypothetical protein
MTRSPLLLSPLALFASSCATRALSTPASSAEQWLAPPSGMHEVMLPSRGEVMHRWILPPTNPWAPYAKYTLLAALGDAPRAAMLPDVDSLQDVQRARAAGTRLGAAGLPADTLWVVDLRGAASVAFGAGLAAAAGPRELTLVPTFNNWPARDELVPAEETLAALVAASPGELDEGGLQSHPVFLLDAWRLAHRFEQPSDESYDNRYALSSSDFPDVAALHANGIRRVVYVVASLEQTETEEDDLHPVFLEWQRAGIRIAATDLDWLSLPVTDPDWDEAFNYLDFDVSPRVTVLQGPSFYRRARGGFGGILARPSSVSLAHGYNGGGAGMHGAGG